MRGMPLWLFQVYQRKRVININVNVFLAGVLAIAAAKLPVFYLGRLIGPIDTFWERLLSSVAAYGIDLVFDLSIYFALHWVANHWKPLAPLSHADRLHHASESPNFFRDAARIQAERVALVPLYMLVALGGMTALQHYASVAYSWAFVWAFLSAILVTRITHTIVGLFFTRSFEDNHIRAKRARIRARIRARNGSGADGPAGGGAGSGGRATTTAPSRP